MPVGAFGGRRDIMAHLAPEGPVYQAGTLSGNPIAMAAGLATLRELTPRHYQILQESTDRLMTGIHERAMAAKIPLTTACCGGYSDIYFIQGLTHDRICLSAVVTGAR